MQVHNKNTNSTQNNAEQTTALKNISCNNSSDYTKSYTVDDVSNISNIIKKPEENYIEIYDVDFDDEITKTDLQTIAVAVTTKETYKDIVDKTEAEKEAWKQSIEDKVNEAGKKISDEILKKISALGYDSKNVSADELIKIINDMLLKTDKESTYEIEILEKMLESLQSCNSIKSTKNTASATVDFNKYIERVLEDVTYEEQNKYHADINEEIENSKQGRLGDCWLLAGLNSLSYSEAGMELIDEAIDNNGDGTYTVNFNGVNVSYTFTDEDLENARKSRQYSSGDDDVLLIELAMEKFLKEVQTGVIELPDDAPRLLSDEEKENMDKNPICGGQLNYLIYILTGERTSWQNNCEHPDNDDFSSWAQSKMPWLSKMFGNSMDTIYDKIEKNPDSICATIAFYGEEGHKGPVVVTDINGNDVVLTGDDRGHDWSIKSVEGDYVTLVNPWDSSVEIVISKDEIAKYATGIEYYEFG